jgi:hypothetical protein
VHRHARLCIDVYIRVLMLQRQVREPSTSSGQPRAAARPCPFLSLRGPAITPAQFEHQVRFLSSHVRCTHGRIKPPPLAPSRVRKSQRRRCLAPCVIPFPGPLVSDSRRKHRFPSVALRHRAVFTRTAPMYPFERRTPTHAAHRRQPGHLPRVEPKQRAAPRIAGARDLDHEPPTPVPP